MKRVVNAKCTPRTRPDVPLNGHPEWYFQYFTESPVGAPTITPTRIFSFVRHHARVQEEQEERQQQEYVPSSLPPFEMIFKLHFG